MARKDVYKKEGTQKKRLSLKFLNIPGKFPFISWKLRAILTVSTAWNTGETGEGYAFKFYRSSGLDY